MAAEIMSYLQIIRKRWWVVVLLFVATIAVILVNALRETPVYRAYVKLQVIAPESEEVSLFTAIRSTSTDEEIVAVEVQFDAALHSYYVAWQTINDLSLGISAAELLEGLTVTADGEFLNVTFTADNPMSVEAIATRHVENAFAYYAQLRAKSATVALQFIQEQLGEEEKALATAQSALLTFKVNHNLDSLSREVSAIQDQVRALELERAKLVLEHKRVQALADKYREEAKADPETSPVDYATLAKANDITIAGIVAQEAEYDQLIQAQRAKLEGLLNLTVENDALNRTVNRIQSNYSFLADKENEARLKQNQANNVSFIQIVEPARMPDQPAPSRTPKLLAVGALVSLIGGIILAFVLEFLSLVSASAQKKSS